MTPDKQVKDFFADRVIKFLIRRIQEFGLYNTNDNSRDNNLRRHEMYVQITNEINTTFGTNYTSDSVKTKWNSLKKYWKAVKEKWEEDGQIKNPQWNYWNHMKFLFDEERNDPSTSIGPLDNLNSLLEVILEPTVASTSTTEANRNVSSELSSSNSNVKTTSSKMCPKNSNVQIKEEICTNVPVVDDNMPSTSNVRHEHSVNFRSDNIATDTDIESNEPSTSSGSVDSLSSLLEVILVEPTVASTSTTEANRNVSSELLSSNSKVKTTSSEMCPKNSNVQIKEETCTNVPVVDGNIPSSTSNVRHEHSVTFRSDNIATDTDIESENQETNELNLPDDSTVEVSAINEIDYNPVDEADDLAWLSYISSQMSRLSLEQKNEMKKKISDIVKK